MLVTRMVGGILRGKATPFQVISACVLGSMIGFMPGLAQAPGLLLALVLLLIIINANLLAATIVAAVAKLASLLLVQAGWQFDVGYFLLDGPTRPVFQSAINAPVLAWFGFENYTATGGLLLGLVFGLLVGLALSSGLTAYRRKMAGLEEGSDRYKKLRARWWSKLLIFVFVGGGHGKKTYEQLAAAKVGLPIRPLGVVFALLVCGLVFTAQALFRNDITAWAVQTGLERANGATVDVREIEVDPRTARVRLVGLAIADPENLRTDIFRAEEVTADLSNRDLLTKRLAFDSVVARDAVSGAERRIPGVLNRPQRPAAPAPDVREGEKSLDDYLQQAEALKERLRQLRDWLEKLDRHEPDDDGPTSPGKPRRETLRDRLEREIREKGIVNVTADHLIADAPRVLIRDLRVEGLRAEQVKGPDGQPEVLDLRGENLSDAPHLVPNVAILRVVSRSGRINGEIDLGGATSERGYRRLAFNLSGLSGDAVGSLLKFVGTVPVRGGTVDLSLDATMIGALLEAPLQVTLNGSTLAAPSIGETTVSQLRLPIGIRGPIDNPAIRFENEALAQALLAAGKTEAAARLRSEADKLAGRAKGEVGKAIGDAIGDDAKKALEEGLKGGTGDRLRDGLGGLLGGSRAKDADKPPKGGEGEAGDGSR